MDQMAFYLHRAINEGYRAGKPVIVLSNKGKVLHGREELEACVRSGTSVSSAVIRGINAKEWAMSDWPATMEAARQVFYVSPAIASLSIASMNARSRLQ